MLDVDCILRIADAYKAEANVDRDTTVSTRVFADSKKLAALRNGADITVSRFNDAVQWFRDNWPDGAEFPEHLLKAEQEGAA